MSPLDVIPVPGHPGFYARRVAVEAWQRAGSPPLVSAGRLYGDQRRAWDGWDARLPGFNPADNPDDESQPLAHCRFVAFDLKYPARDRAAMIREGFRFPYDYELWHGELPNVRSYSIVRSLPAATSANNSVTYPTILEDDMLSIHAPNRGVAIIGPGYFKSLTPEEAENVKAITTKQISGNDRQFDLWRAMALGGTKA